MSAPNRWGCGPWTSRGTGFPRAGWEVPSPAPGNPEMAHAVQFDHRMHFLGRRQVEKTLSEWGYVLDDIDRVVRVVLVSRAGVLFIIGICASCGLVVGLALATAPTP